VTGAMPSSQALFDHYDAHVRHAMHDRPLQTAEADARLAARLEAWRRPRPLPGAATSSLAEVLSGQVFAMEPNEHGVASVELFFGDEACQVRLVDRDGLHTITCGLGQWIEGTTDMPGIDLHHGYALAGAVVVAAAGWQTDGSLAMEWIFVETAFRDTLALRFEGPRLTLSREVNINSGRTRHADLVGHAVPR
jgi:hypothetical protein